MLALLFLAPLFVAFEMGQLVICERYLGIKQLVTGRDPRQLPLREGLAACWVVSLVLYWIWTALLFGLPFARVQALCLIGVSLGGYGLRRNAPLKWILVILTFEGAVRIGMLVSLTGALWRHLRLPG
jgi:hypothetical protein